MLLIALIIVAAMLCAIMALHSARLLVSALWLAGASALIALLLYLLGAREIAVVELSVGAGLVTILFVFAISVAGDEKMDVSTVIPRPVAIGLVAVTAVLLAGFALRQPELSGDRGISSTGAGFSEALWQQRGLDVLVQIALIFGGVLGVLGLLADGKTPNLHAAKDEGRGTKTPAINGNGHRILEATVTGNGHTSVENPKSKTHNETAEVKQ